MEQLVHFCGMKWFPERYTYLIIAAVAVAGVLLQGAWLNQLFQSQHRQTEVEIEQIVINASARTMYINISPGTSSPASGYSDFFLSPQWLNLKQGFDDITDQQPQHHVNSIFSFVDAADSAIVTIRFIVFRDSSLSGGLTKKTPKTVHRGPVAKRHQRVRRSLFVMDSLVHKQLLEAGITVRTQYALYGYEPGEKNIGRQQPAYIGNAAFASRKYSISFRDAYKYQLIVPEMNLLVIYRMRYYILSALFMVLLVGTAVYFLIKFIQKRRLYDLARTAFISNMSHELKSPIAIIDVALESITRYQLMNQPDKLQSYIKVSLAELQRLKSMIEQVLNLEEIDNGRIRLRPELYDVQQGLYQVISSMQLQNPTDEGMITYIPSDEPCFVNGDPVHLPNVFYNLIDNAVKYGGPSVKVTITSYTNNGQVAIRFTDTGPGIDRSYHDQVFERFFRVQQEGDIHNVKGNGLGLDYVKQILEMHKGSIVLNSEINKGSTFTIYLPAYHEV